METRGFRKTKTGTIVSNKMDKTVVVKVETTIPHPKYGKTVKRAKRYYAHNELGSLEIGDKVKIMETRPLSKLKCWRVIEKV